MDLLRRLFSRPSKKAVYRLFLHGKEARRKSPLPALAPGLYRERPRDRYAKLEELIAEADATVADTLHVMRQSNERVRKCAVYNETEILRIPDIYRLALHLKKRGLERFLHGAHRLGAAFQLCAFFGESDTVDRLREHLMPLLLGIYARHYGIQFLKETEIANLIQKRRFNPESKEDLELRDKFLAAYKGESQRLGEVSADRFLQRLGTPDPDSDIVAAIRDTLRYSMRLMGRTAAELSPDEELDVNYLAAYIGVIHSVMAAQAATGKRLPVLLAEEHGRAQTHHAVAGRELTARYNIRALHDLMSACRCSILQLFQGRDEVVIYAAPERLYIRRVRDEDGVERWRAFRSKRRDETDPAHRSQGTRSAAYHASHDPKDEDLVPAGDHLES